MFDSIIYFRKSKEEKPVSKSIITQTELTSVTKEQLKEDWLDPIVRNAIDLQVELINLGFRIMSDDPKVSTDIAIINNNSEWDDFNDGLVRDALIFGNAYVKLLPNASGSRYVGLWNMDPIRTDFYRLMNGNVKMNPDGTPYGYIETIPFGYQTQMKMDTDEYNRRGRVYPNERVVYFNFETLPGSIEGISRLRSAHQLIRDKWVIEKGIRQTAFHFTRPILKYKIGVKERPLVSPDRIKEVADALQTNEQISSFVTPWWEDVDILYPKAVSDMSKNLDPIIDQLPPALGIPKSIIFETGKDAQRGALRQQIRILVSRIKRKRKKLISFYNKQLFPKIASKNKWKTLPTISFSPVTMEDVESLAKRIKTYIEAGILEPSEVKNDIKRIEDLI